MGDYSDRLRAAREQAGLSIEQISERTRIKADMLRALERGDTSRLPGPFYTKTFIRTYARELGLPADELAADFATTLGPPAQPAIRPQDIAPVRRIAGYEAPRASSWQLLPIAAIVAAVVFFGSSRWGADNVGAPEPGATGTAGRPASELPAGTAGRANTAGGQAVAALPDRLELDIRPSGSVWVAADADGERVVYRLLNPGERTRVVAAHEITLRVGNAGAFVYSINGVDGTMLGAPGEVRDVRITRENYGSYRR